jgi:hypothetical protein
LSAHPKREALIDYVVAETPEGDEGALEEHLFDCDDCSNAAAELAKVGDAVRAAVSAGKAGKFATEGLLRTLEAAGVGLRHYHLHPGGRFECTVGASDVFVVVHYTADFTDVERVTLVALRDDGSLIRRMEDIPVPAGAKALHVLLRGDMLRKLPTATHTVTLSDGDRIVAKYTLSHTAFAG